MDLDDLDIFRCVVREGGITRAATRLHRVPSNVTTRIKRFEERLGVPLFRRQGRSLALTEAGRALLGHAERLLQAANEAEQDIRSGAVRGVLRIGSLESTAGVRLPPVLSSFSVFKKAVRYILKELVTSRVGTPASQGRLAIVMDVPLEDLVPGKNGLELVTANVPTSYPPIVCNVDLVLATK